MGYQRRVHGTKKKQRCNQILYTKVSSAHIFIPRIIDYGIYPVIMQCINIIIPFVKQFLDPNTGLKFVLKRQRIIIFLSSKKVTSLIRHHVLLILMYAILNA